MTGAEKKQCTWTSRRLLALFGVGLVVVVGSLVAYSNAGGSSSVRGLLEEVSHLPNASDAPYADCLQIAHLADVVDWPSHLPDPPEGGILVAWPGFLDRQLTGAASLVAGDAVSVKLQRMEEVDEKYQTMQRADSVSVFDLPMYFSGDVAHIRDFRYPRRSIRSDAVQHGRPVVSLQQILTQPVARQTVPGRSERMMKRMEEIELAAARHGGWAAWDAELKPFYIHLLEKSRDDGGIRRDDSFFHRTYNGRFSELVERQEPASLKMLVALDRELAKKAIDLLVVPFPFREEVTADLFADPEYVPEDSILSPGRLQMLHWLMEHDVEVIDLLPALAEQRESKQWLYYDFEDMHPAQDGIDIAAEVIGERLRRYGWQPEYHNLKRVAVEFAMPEKLGERFAHHPEGKNYPARQVVQANGEFLPTRVKKSRLLLIGDSFSRVPGLYEVSDAALREQLAFETGVLPRELSIKGSAAQLMRNLRREGPGYLDGVEVCVFVFAQYPMFTEVDPADGDADLLYRWEIVPLP